MIGIYLDASQKIGTGHLQRCLQIYKSYLPKKVFFLTRSLFLKNLFSKKKLPYYFVTNEKRLNEFLTSKKIKVIIFDIVKFDSFLSKSFFKGKEIKKVFRVLIANTLNMKVKPDLVIFPVVTKFRSKSNKIFVGEKYAVLPKLPKKRKIKNINNIMISMGGSDPRKITLKTLKILKESNLLINLNIVIGSLSKIKDTEIKKILSGKKIRFSIFRSQKNLKKIMLDSDLLITNSGITKFEASLMRLPSIIIANDKETENNQVAFAQKKTSIYLGYFKSEKIKKLNKVIKTLKNNINKILIMQENCKKFLDHRGAFRIRQIIDKNFKKK
jgi:UDP-2,4-diacetamido-2,4,6-trideoxy-beta-L-altropyranose hydrolase